MSKNNRDLPCAVGHCVYNSVCCNWGASVDDRQVNYFKPGQIEWAPDEQGYRTVVVDGHCIFMVAGKCSIHGEPYYPSVCRIFPFDGYKHDISICPACAKDTDSD
jgi:Fe-S-cluster containining protein